MLWLYLANSQVSVYRTIGPLVGTNITCVFCFKVVSRPEDVRRNSSCLDIVDHAGALVEKIWFDPNEKLPRNRSFEFSLESCVHEAKINKNGRIHTVHDVDMHKHLDTAEDLEMDGITEGTGTVSSKSFQLSTYQLSN